MCADSNRRTFLSQAIALPTLVALESRTASAAVAAQIKPGALKVVCVGGHPDDPESGCGGTLALYAGQGHRVTIIYLTRGERGIPGKSESEAAAIRTAEAETACGIIGAKPVFAGQIDGATELNRARVDALGALLEAETPDVVFTHWPIDTHMDHQVASMLTIRAWMSLRSPSLYFFEVDAGDQTQGFTANTYIDITPVLEKKQAALFAHASQDGRGIWREHHEIMAQWRGRELGVPAAEAFVHVSRAQSNYLPGL